MIDETEQSWKKVIEEYIDNLKESENQEKYTEELLSTFLMHTLLEKTSGADHKAIDKMLSKVAKTPATEKNREKFTGYYEQALENGWIESLSLEIEKIKSKKNFHNIWISRSLNQSIGVLPATHCAKLTHSSSSGSSILDQSASKSKAYLTTSSQRQKIIDGTYLNATCSKQIKFLMLEYSGRYLFEEINDDKKEVLEPFAESNEELDKWFKGFQSILNAKPDTDILLKQTYFPVGEDYHLLTVLQSSSLAQQFYQEYFDKDARRQQEQFTKARKSGKYFPGIQQRLLGVNKLLITQSQHQNATVLNGKRGGIQRLFNSQAPTWVSQKKPPIYQKSWFYRGIPYSAVQRDIDYLRSFLLRNERLSLSTRNPEKRKWLIKWGQNIIDTVLFYAQQIQMLAAGWSGSDDIKLKLSQQYFLDPSRDCEAFQTARKAADWQSEISRDFANWLNESLKGKDKQFTPQKEHRKLWELLMSNALRELHPTQGEIHKREENA